MSTEDSNNEKLRSHFGCVCNCPGGSRGCHGTGCLCTCRKCESNRVDGAHYYDDTPFEDEDEHGDPRELDFN